MSEIEEQKEATMKEESVYASVIYYRLQKDLEINDALLKKNEPKEGKKNFLEKIWVDSIENPIRRMKADKVSGKRKTILDNIEKFKKDTLTEYALCEDEEAFRALLRQEVFKDDTYGMSRIVMGLRIALDNTYKFAYEKESLTYVSKLLFDEEDIIWELRKSVEENYYRFAKEQLMDIERGVMVGLSIASIAAWMFSPIYLASAAASSKVVTSVLAQIGRSAPGIIAPGITKITAITLVTSLAFLGINGLGFSVLNKLEKRDIIKEFRNMSVKDLNFLFSIKAAIIQEARRRVPNEVLKTTIDDCLNWMNDLRSDAEYMLIIERTDAVNAKKKIKSCNLLTERLAEIVGI